MRKKYDIKKQDLEEMYIEKNMTRYHVAEHYGCSDVLIKQYIRKWNLQKPKNLEWKNKERKVNVKCVHCESEFQVIPSKAKRQKFCSHKCSADARWLGRSHQKAMRTIRSARYRSRMKMASVELTIEEENKIREIYTNRPDGYEVDHIIPISRGGKHHPDNLQYLKIKDNRSKRNKLPEEL